MRFAVAAAALAAMLFGASGAVRFRHHFITEDIPQSEPRRSGFGTPVLADLDNDGDLDFTVSVRAEKIYWFENRGKDDWARHEVGANAPGQLGALALDVDRDGWKDLMIGGYWFRNPRRPREAPFTRLSYDSRIKTEIHDIAAEDFDGDGRQDILVLGDREGCFWYSIPENPAAGDWPRTTVTMAVLDTEDDIHSGFFPRGAADLDGDGDPDIVLPDRWLENRNRGREWVRHPLPWGKRGPWGLSARSWIADLNRDGAPDIVITDSDQSASRAAVLWNDGKRPPSFTQQMLPKTAPGVRGSFHSLAVADFDGDGDLDIVTVEQEDVKILPQGAGPRWFLWENLDGKGGRWQERVLLDAGLGGHDIAAGDIDGDGDIDIASKIWHRWPGNGNGGRFHADWLENLGR